MSIFFSQLNSYAFIVVCRSARETGKGYIIKRLPTLEQAQAMAKELSQEDDKNFYWAMPQDEF